MQLFLIVVVSLVFLHHPVEQKERKKRGVIIYRQNEPKLLRLLQCLRCVYATFVQLIHMFPLKNVQRQETTSKMCS